MAFAGWRNEQSAVKEVKKTGPNRQIEANKASSTACWQRLQAFSWPWDQPSWSVARQLICCKQPGFKLRRN